MTPEARVAASFAAQPFMKTLGARLERVSDGEVEIHLPLHPSLLQHTGVLHAGVITAVVDSACGFAAATRLAADQTVVSVEFKLNLLAPATGESVRAIGKIVRAGRTLTVCTGEVWAVDGSALTLVAVMQATMMAVSA